MKVCMTPLKQAAPLQLSAQLCNGVNLHERISIDSLFEKEILSLQYLISKKILLDFQRNSLPSLSLWNP